MKKIIGLLLIGIMFLSGIAIAGVQTFSGDQASGQQSERVEIPAQPIIDYRLSPAQLSEALSRGLTVMTYTYDRNCLECLNERVDIEQIALSKDFQNQIILEEVSRSSGNSTLEISSYFGSKTFDEFDTNSTIDSLCELVALPPLGCAVRKNIGE